MLSMNIIQVKFENVLKKVNSQVKVRSKADIITFLAFSNETGLITGANPSFTKGFPKDEEGSI